MNEDLIIYHNIDNDNEELLQILKNISGNFKHLHYDNFHSLEDCFLVVFYTGQKNDLEPILSKNRIFFITYEKYLENLKPFSENYRFFIHVLDTNHQERYLDINLKAFIEEAYKVHELNNYINELEEKIFDLAFATTNVLEQKEMADELATKDGMTKLYNHSFFREFLQNEFIKAKIDNNIFTIAILDLDFFKQINDKYGHLKGDEVIKTFAQYILKHTRKNDIAARYGGEEFAMLFKNINHQEAIEIIESLRNEFYNHVFDYGDSCFKATFSAGVTEFSPSFKDTVEMIKLADEALYQSKKNGRNRTTIILKDQL
ncbi:MAG: GGDEF domain-containing protein [Deferribacterales bacterium]